MSDPQPPSPDRDPDGINEPNQGAKVYDKPERTSSRSMMWLIILVILVILGIVLFGYIL